MTISDKQVKLKAGMIARILAPLDQVDRDHTIKEAFGLLEFVDTWMKLKNVEVILGTDHLPQSTTVNINPPPKKPRWVPVKEAAKRFKLHPSTVYTYAYAGRIPMIREPGKMMKVDVNNAKF